jgi:NAD(P)-dependent dehydrogenase (short-subunit alcohol dehydrogenase family)
VKPSTESVARDSEGKNEKMEQNQMARYPSLKDRVVFVTGGASGIGASIVEHFCEQGSRVSFVDINCEAAETLVNSIQSTGQPVPRFIECDLKDISALRAAVASVISQDGPIRVLVNNAANDDRHALEGVTPEYFDDRMAMNIKHQLFAAQAVQGPMADAGGGAIVNIGSTTYMAGQGGMVCYSMAKSAVAGLTRSLARDLGSKNIRVNMIAPGWVMTERQKELWLTAESEVEVLKEQCIKRLIEPSDFARTVLFFSADDSSMCTAQTYVVDGGWT